MFSRGGRFSKFDQINFATSSPKALKRLCGVFSLFLESLRKSRFFGGRSVLKISIYIIAESAFRKTLGYVTKSGYLKIVQRGNLCVGRGSNP